MKRTPHHVGVTAMLFAVVTANCSRPRQPLPEEGDRAGYYSGADYALLAKRDAHVHLNTGDASLLLQARVDNFSVTTINIDSPLYPPIDEQENIAVRQMAAFPGRVAYAATFSVADFNAPQWGDETVSRLTTSFRKGAVAVKFWKNIGMGLKDADGRFVMIDNVKFDPVLEFIARHHVTAIGHFGEPKNCWLPLAAMTVKSDRTYYEQHPEYHMFRHPEYPSYEQELEARDTMLTRHPELTFVGAHLGSLEWDVDELGKRLDAFPTMAVDMAARMPHLEFLAGQNREKVRRFVITYQNRLIYGTDQAVGPKTLGTTVRTRAHEIWTRDWKFLTSGEVMTSPAVDGSFRGLRLPRETIDKIYLANAERWFNASAHEREAHQQ